MVLTFKKPDHIQVKPGQYFAIYPSNHLPREIMKPLLLTIASGSHDDYIQFTFPKAAHRLSIKKILEVFKLHSGRSILLDGPFGNGFTIGDTLDPILIIGAGSGISLLQSIKHSVNTNIPVSVIYSAKDIKNIPNLDEINIWAEDNKNYLTLTQTDVVPRGWYKGRVNDYLMQTEFDKNTRIIICGPDAFIKAVVDIFQEKIHPLENIFISSNHIKMGNNENIYSLESDMGKEFLSEEKELSKKKLCM
ncbi:FAD-dependent oxidoreductase [Legionella gresilensis]|uniref:FAD-dependent oxidoreductase n=1 Tax=Legionella gresilensis TaxID=91823 RepID=UPI0010415F21|nr:FAD-dependent oxidoreductase [Legionella gresilensis]